MLSASNTKSYLFWSIQNNTSCLPDNFFGIYEEVLPYVRDFLCSPHPYRKGVVCPFVPSALLKDKIYFTYYQDDKHSLVKESCQEFIRECIEFYKNNIGASKDFGALIILFARDFEIEKLLEFHFLSKKQCVDNHLMLGALWDKNQAQSLHCKDFYPLRTPTPILVIRDLTIQDLVFLEPEHYSVWMRISFLKAFIEKFNKKNHLGHKNIAVRRAISMKNAYLFKAFIKFLAALSFVLLFLYWKIM